MKSDMESKRQVDDELEWDPAGNVTDIGVEVRDRVVTLTGTGDSMAERSVVRGAAWSAPGVHAVIDNLTVG